MSSDGYGCTDGIVVKVRFSTQIFIVHVSKIIELLHKHIK